MLRPWRIILVVLLLGVGAYASVWAGGLAAVGVAYKAKMVCSGVFVAGRAPENVLADLEHDDLTILRYFNASIQKTPPMVTVSGLGITRQARYDSATGCSLIDRSVPDPIRASPSFDAVASARSAVPAKGDTRTAPVTAPYGALHHVIDEAFVETDATRPKHTLAVVVMRGGEIVAERYARGIQPSTPLIGWSMTKSVMNALIGVLVRDGRLSVSMRAPVPEWQSDGDPRGRITLDNLLHMSSGLHFDEETINPLNDVVRMLLREPDAAAYAARQSLTNAPGTHWQYSSGTTNILSRVIRSVFADEVEYRSFPRRALFDPLGMTSAVLEADESGTFVGSSFMYATAREWARFGALYLNDGVWEGRRILPEGWVAYTRTPAPADPLRHYGAHIWLDVPDGYHTGVDDLPDEVFHAAGHEGQFVTIVPSRRMVIVRLGRTRSHGAWDHVKFVKDVLAAAGPD